MLPIILDLLIMDLPGKYKFQGARDLIRQFGLKPENGFGLRHPLECLVVIMVDCLLL